MDREIVLYHNPRCSKSRQARKLLQERGIEPRVRRYLDDPPSLEELRTLAAKLDGDVLELVRTNEPEFRPYKGQALDEEALLRLIAEHPRLLQRPIAVRGDRAVVGRPPERVLELLEG